LISSERTPTNQPHTVLNASQLQVYQAYYDNITATVGCQTAADSLACLRTVSYEALYNASVDFTFKPILDGRFLTQRGSQSLALGQIARVPVLIGSNTDEGTAPFFTPRNILNTDTDIANFVQTLNQNLNLDNSTISTVMQLYPNDPTVGCPFESGPITFPSQGLQFKRGAAIGGDFYIHAGRRFYATWQAENTQMPIYTYRFNQRPWNNMEVDVTTVEPVASTHFTEIVYVWDNPDMNVNWIGPYPTYHQLQKFISRCWVSFVYNADPNHHGLENQPLWPLYDPSQPMNIVFQVGSSYVEPDVYRKEQLAFWTTVLPELLT
jgi:carboxylesterase type B